MRTIIISGVDANYEVPERSGKIISTERRSGLPTRSSIYDDHKKIRLLTPRTHASTWDWPPPLPCGRPHAVDIKYTYM